MANAGDKGWVLGASACGPALRAPLHRRPLRGPGKGLSKPLRRRTPMTRQYSGKPSGERRDHYAEVTDRIVAAL